MSELMPFSREQAQMLEGAARYCAILAAVDHAFIAGDEPELHRLLSGLDPIEVRLTANTLQALWRLWQSLSDQDRGGTNGEGNGGSPPLATADASDARPSAPVVPLDTYSRKAPCA